ncbi:MAG: hypothetical protein WD873_04505, partial [Candidatus Hydrogenedentales bacterium]
HLNHYSIDVFRERLHGQTPPRLRELSLVKLQNDQFDVWFAPDDGGAMVRFKDRRNGRELIPPYPHLAASTHNFLEWREHGRRLLPLRPRFKVVAHTPQRLELEAALENGLLFSRVATLADNGHGLLITWMLFNPTSDTCTPDLLIRPSFRTSNRNVWTNSTSGWRRAHANAALKRGAEPEFALRLRNPSQTLIADYAGAAFVPIEVDWEDGVVVLGARYSRAPLDPGESRTITAEFRLTATHPGRL